MQHVEKIARQMVPDGSDANSEQLEMQRMQSNVVPVSEFVHD